MGNIPEGFFRELDGPSAERFRQWARENYVPGREPEPYWHPVVREEWARLDAEGPPERPTEVGKIGKFREDYTQAVLCPRCQVRTLPVGYPGALSRADNETEICSACGSEEAFADFKGTGKGAGASTEDWPIPPGPDF